MDFREVYKFPFKLQFPDIGWVYDAGDNFIFQFDLLMDEEDKEMFLSYLNDEEGSKKPKVKFVFENGLIKTESGADVILIRGWGNLTNTLGLSTEDASSVQDSLGEWIVKKLNNEN